MNPPKTAYIKLTIKTPIIVSTKIAEFAISLSEQQEKKFYEILKGLRTVQFGELGADGTPAKKSKDDLITEAKAFAEKKSKETGKDYTACLEAEMAKLSTHAEFKE